LDRDLVGKVEKLAGENALIFQLPMVPFPENPPVVNMSDYEHLRGYLHSETLRWSYGGVKGRKAFEWQQSLPGESQSLVESLRKKDFRAIWIDRRGYADQGESIMVELAKSGLTLSLATDTTFLVLLR
jgi:phosphoglycerol transferase